jgi:hypothetical protein
MSNVVESNLHSTIIRAYLTAATFLKKIDPLDVSLMFYLEIDQLIDLLERPLFRHLQLRLLECEDDPYCEGSGAMLFLTLKRLMMLLPQSTSYTILRERLSVARYRQSAAVSPNKKPNRIQVGSETDVFVKQIVKCRRLHVWAKWRMIRSESLEEEPCRIVTNEQKFKAQQQRREWLGYADEEEELATKQKMKDNLLGKSERAELVGVYERLDEKIEASKGVTCEDFQEGNDECEACASELPPNDIDATKKQMKRRGSSDNELKPEWREFWANR